MLYEFAPKLHETIKEKIELENGEVFNSILQDIQFHPVTDKILHIDFYQLFSDKEITMEIPVVLLGSAPGVVNGGNLRFPYRKLKVKALPDNLPDFINADISKLDIGDKVYVTELGGDNFTLLHPDNTVVVQVRISRLTIEEEEAEEEGEEDGDWVLVDLGDVIVHVMQRQAREYYDLEGLWSVDIVNRPNQDAI